MKCIVKELFQDCSTPEIFCFSLRCEECGEVWKNVPIKFSRAGVLPETEGKQIILETIYKREKEAALQKAMEQARKAFNFCPICERLVCDKCFLICSDLDMCRSCAERLEEHGEPVSDNQDA
jgi:hypothetical protein